MWMICDIHLCRLVFFYWTNSQIDGCCSLIIERLFSVIVSSYLKLVWRKYFTCHWAEENEAAFVINFNSSPHFTPILLDYMWPTFVHSCLYFRKWSLCSVLLIESTVKISSIEQMPSLSMKNCVKEKTCLRLCHKSRTISKSSNVKTCQSCPEGKPPTVSDCLGTFQPGK